MWSYLRARSFFDSLFSFTNFIFWSIFSEDEKIFRFFNLCCPVIFFDFPGAVGGGPTRIPRVTRKT
ncbi:hypothetical protein LEP1GSC132_1018 [Leptospira kirschneri str. 200803703]|uniref:hypothetical protein n=1 Tax=Leptospira kirschneri TaxID=29507 RepID=UPI0002BE32A3|nr:hypothetical protein [Leptospira kirschneri]EMN25808.1 hypothetical protein LEP1GSC065_3106 [Leptospira kirschneri serovar Sokoine str. RM1]EMO66548.1 hypothetical protein LEP1GSC132_1018 [Leptospira kirschneri str. 200803703]